MALVCTRHDCSNPLPPKASKFCSPRCRNTVQARRKRHRALAVKDEAGKQLNAPVVSVAAAADGRGSMRRGPEYERFVADGGPALLDEGMTHDLIAAHYGVSRVTVTHWLAAYREDLRTARDRASWSMSDEARACLEDFRLFRARYFKVGRGLYKGKPPATTPFHMRWIEAILDAMEHGGQLMILSPPRHGKSLLMTHFVIWQIVRNPDIAIIWVSGSENVAKRFGSTVKDELAHNRLLAEDFLGPGGSFAPSSRSGAQWRDDEFEVATRTIPQPAPTFKAIGRGGTLLSMDADLIVTDDIEDHKRTAQPAQRESTREWFGSDLDSRKEEHTAWIYIGSRQHPDDLAGHLLENEEWDAIVETAHDWDCTIPESRIDEHVDCVLWPEVRSFRYLMKKKRGTGGAAKYEMQFLNRPRPSGMLYFQRDDMEQCRNPGRVLGHVPANTRLIAGLDPSGRSGYQSVVLWAVDVAERKRYLVDLENEVAGSTPHLRSVLERWAKHYRVRDWVIEDNIIDDVLQHDAVVRKIKETYGLVFHPHYTSGSNKWDDQLGITSMIPLYEEDAEVGRRVDLPYGDEDTRVKVDLFITQHVNFDGVRKGTRQVKDDLVHAAWFPESVIKQWLKKRASKRTGSRSKTWYPHNVASRAPWRGRKGKVST